MSISIAFAFLVGRIGLIGRRAGREGGWHLDKGKAAIPAPSPSGGAVRYALVNGGA